MRIERLKVEGDKTVVRIVLDKEDLIKMIAEPLAKMAQEKMHEILYAEKK